MKRIYGLTCDDVTNYAAIVAGLRQLPHRVTLRICLDPGTPLSSYLPAVKALNPVADLMLQPVDSSEMSKFSLRQYSQRIADTLSVLGSFADYLECGNEVNGTWCGKASDVADKVNNALTQTSRFGIEGVVCYYFDADDPGNMANWGASYPMSPDVALVSVYPNSSQARPSFDAMFGDLQAMHPTTPKGFGEYGTEDPNGNNPSPMTLRANLVRVVERYTPPSAVQGYIGGGFYWDASEDVFTAAQAGLLPCLQQVWASAA